MDKKEPWKMSEGCERDDTLPSRLVDTFISCVPNFELFRTYGPTLDATMLETLRCFDNACTGERNPAETRREGHVVDGRWVPSSSSNQSLAAGQTLRNYFGPTPDATVMESASAISILQGTTRSSSSELDESSSSRHCSNISACISQKGSAMLEGVKSLLSVNKGSDREKSVSPVKSVLSSKGSRDKFLSPKHVSMNPIQVAWDIFESKECHSRVPPKISIEQLPSSDHLEEFKPIFNEQHSCCLHFDDGEPPDGQQFQQGDAPYAKSTPKKVKTFWGITRINIFDDCSKTYEIMGITPYQPQYVPDQIDGIFVIGPPSKDK